MARVPSRNMCAIPHASRGEPRSRVLTGRDEAAALISCQMRHGDAPSVNGPVHLTSRPQGSAFELWDTYVRFRSDVWTGQAVRWQNLAETLFRLLELREELDPKSSREAEQARDNLLNLVCYLNCAAGSIKNPSAVRRPYARGAIACGQRSSSESLEHN